MFSAAALTKHDVFHQIDESSGTIGRRYARSDEIAIPYNITVDFESLQTPQTVTLRERDSTNQVRVPVGSQQMYSTNSIVDSIMTFMFQVNDVASVVRGLSLGELKWMDIERRYPKQERPQSL